MKGPSQYFRAGVGAVIIDSGGRVLALERSDIPGAWQFPQGGLDAGEELLAAIFREVREETGISRDDLDLIEKYPEPLVYELPEEARSIKTGRGQVQYWFLFRFQGSEGGIDIAGSDEFSSWQWMPMNQVLSAVVRFRSHVYRHLAEYFSPYLLTE